jgi:CHAT domain-containing protein/Tfp pilus assembly protein PilF
MRFDESEEVARTLLTRIEQEKKFDSLETAQVLDLLVEALYHNGKARQRETREMAERAMKIKEPLLDSNDPRLAITLRNRALLEDDAGDRENARRLFQRALSIQEAALGPDAPEVATTLTYFGNVLATQGSWDQAGPFLQRAVEIGEKNGDSSRIDLSRALTGLGKLFQFKGEPATGKGFLERAIRIQQQAFGADDPRVVGTMVSLGDVVGDLGDLAEARNLYEHALKIIEKAPGGDDLGSSLALGGLARASWASGDYRAAVAFQERAVASREKRNGLESAAVAKQLINLAIFLRGSGDYPRARRVYERALNLLPADDPALINLLNGLANLHVEMGAPDEATPIYERALALARQRLAPKNTLLATLLDNLAFAFSLTGRDSEAKPLYESAIEICAASRSPGHPECIEKQVDLAELWHRTGNDLKARSTFDLALRHLDDHPGSEDAVDAKSLGRYGEFLYETGDLEAARSAYQRALVIREKTCGLGHPEVGRILTGLAQVVLAGGETTKALELAHRSESISRAHFQTVLRGLTARDALLFQGIRTSGLDVELTAIVSISRDARSADVVRDVWDDLVRSRAMVLDELAARHRSELDLRTPESASLAVELETARNRVSRLFLQYPDSGASQEYRGRLEKALLEEEGAERNLAERCEGFRRERVMRQIGLEDVAAALPKDAILIAFAQYNRQVRPQTRGPSSSRKPTQMPAYLALILRSGETSPHVVPLGAANRVENLVRHWREEVGAEPKGLARTGRSSEAAYRQAGAQLRGAIWDPLARFVEGTRRVFIVPDGVLHLVNFATLPVGGEKYLIETGPPIHYLSAERDLVAIPADPSRGVGLLAVGGPDYDAPPSDEPAVKRPDASHGAPRQAHDRSPRAACEEFRRTRFEPLPGSLAEAREVASLWPADDRIQILTGAQATEASLKELAHGNRVLHIATHGFLLQRETCAPASGWVRGAELGIVTDRVALDLARGNPLVLVGLALAGANRRNEIANETVTEDGILTGEEVASLDLEGVDWVVLSACDTAAGRVQTGEGVLGLRRAFRIAGAKTLIMSLWAVDDAVTQEWMRRLYTARLSGLSTLDAMSQAAMGVLQTRRSKGAGTHPFYWGPFVAEGGWN